MMGLVPAMFYVIIAVVGSVGNAALLVVLRRDKSLQRTFGSSLRMLMSAQATVDLAHSLVGVPLIAMSIGWAHWSMWQRPLVCWVLEVFLIRLNLTSQWYLCTLAFTRLAAAYWPALFRSAMARGWTTRLPLLVAAPVLGNWVMVVSVLAGWAEMRNSKREQDSIY